MGYTSLRGVALINLKQIKNKSIHVEVGDLTLFNPYYTLDPSRRLPTGIVTEVNICKDDGIGIPSLSSVKVIPSSSLTDTVCIMDMMILSKVHKLKKPTKSKRQRIKECIEMDKERVDIQENRHELCIRISEMDKERRRDNKKKIKGISINTRRRVNNKTPKQ